MVTSWTIPHPIFWKCRKLLPHPSHKLRLALQLHRTTILVRGPNETSTTGTFSISTILRAFQRQMKTRIEPVRIVSTTLTLSHCSFFIIVLYCSFIVWIDNNIHVFLWVWSLFVLEWDIGNKEHYNVFACWSSSGTGLNYPLLYNMRIEYIIWG